ncbi:MAG TPA: patatin-like phospholipase family protein [Gemmataceae bacterium]|nr:patatin-like phospholipase family protein [Gemmataceae bacterium]
MRGIIIVAVVAIGLPACQSLVSRDDRVGPVPVTDLVDRQSAGDRVPVLDVRVIESVSDQSPAVVRASVKGPASFNVLVLSGGGAYGAYSAGVLAGWSEAGTRPKFDVVTGVSTGALVATLAFLGPARDPDLRKFYTRVTDKDIYARRSDLAAVFSDSLADSKPLARLIEATVGPELLREVAAEHAKGRRLYVGTTHLDGRRLVVWDMGAIAARGRPADLALFRRVLLASAAIPGFFPPVPIPIEVDGKVYEEFHVDGGVTASVFFRPPQVPRERLAALGDRPLAGSNLYVIVAGKLFSDPAPVARRLLPIAESAISALLYSQTRGDLFQLYALCLSTGMNYRLSAVPADVPVPDDATSFNPVEMTRLFETGRERARAGTLWRSTPPGTQSGEEVPIRGGIRLATSPAESSQRKPR